MAGKRAKLTDKEKSVLLALKPKPGDIIVLVRNHPHVSNAHPFLHLDAITFIYISGERFRYVGKEHIPVIPG